MRKVNLAEKLSMFDDHWNPRIVGELNGARWNPPRGSANLAEP